MGYFDQAVGNLKNQGFFTALKNAAHPEDRWEKRGLGWLLDRTKNPVARQLFGDLKRAYTSPGIYNDNDIRNRGLSIATSAEPGWREYLGQASMAGAAQGTADSGFMAKKMQQAAASQEAQTQGQVLQETGQMKTANEAFRQKMIEDAMRNVAGWLSIKRQNRAALQARMDALAGANYANSGGTNPWMAGLGSVMGAIGSYGISQGW